MSESGQMAKVEHVADALERVFAKLERLDERVGDLRVDIVGLRNAIDNVRALVDGVHARALDLELEHTELSKRVRVLEDAHIELKATAAAAAAEMRTVADSTALELQTHQGRRVAVTTAAAVGGGGFVALLAEVVRVFVGMP